jgi:hypothetical protein
MTDNQQIENESQMEQIGERFYLKSQDYWSKQPATVNGMLGGFDYVSDSDVQQSQKFLQQILNVGFTVFK